MKRQTLIVFSKFCVDCVWPEAWAKILKFATKNGYKIEVERTTYHPKRHEKATALWGDDNYTAFLMTPKGYPIDILELSKSLTTEGGWQDDMQGLRRTKDAFGKAESMVADSKNKKKATRRRKGSRRKVDAD